MTDRMADEQDEIEPGQVWPSEVSGGETLTFRASTYTRMAPYCYHIDGTSCGRKVGLSLTRDGAKQLALLILGAL